MALEDIGAAVSGFSTGFGLMNDWERQRLAAEREQRLAEQAMVQAKQQRLGLMRDVLKEHGAAGPQVLKEFGIETSPGLMQVYQQQQADDEAVGQYLLTGGPEKLLAAAQQAGPESRLWQTINRSPATLAALKAERDARLALEKKRQAGTDIAQVYEQAASEEAGFPEGTSASLGALPMRTRRSLLAARAGHPEFLTEEMKLQAKGELEAAALAQQNAETMRLLQGGGVGAGAPQPPARNLRRPPPEEGYGDMTIPPSQGLQTRDPAQLPPTPTPAPLPTILAPKIGAKGAIGIDTKNWQKEKVTGPTGEVTFVFTNPVTGEQIQRPSGLQERRPPLSMDQYVMAWAAEKDPRKKLELEVVLDQAFPRWKQLQQERATIPIVAARQGKPLELEDRNQINAMISAKDALQGLTEFTPQEWARYGGQLQSMGQKVMNQLRSLPGGAGNLAQSILGPVDPNFARFATLFGRLENLAFLSAGKALTAVEKDVTDKFIPLLTDPPVVAQAKANAYMKFLQGTVNVRKRLAESGRGDITIDLLDEEIRRSVPVEQLFQGITPNRGTVRGAPGGAARQPAGGGQPPAAEDPRDGLSRRAFGVPYNQLSPADKARVDKRVPAPVGR